VLRCSEHDSHLKCASGGIAAGSTIDSTAT
jgi:hypothetical protein